MSNHENKLEKDQQNKFISAFKDIIKDEKYCNLHNHVSFTHPKVGPIISHKEKLSKEAQSELNKLIQRFKNKIL